MDWLTTVLRAFAKPFQWWVTVAPWERGLRIRLGKVASELAPGIHFRIPFLDRIYRQSIRLRTIWQNNQTLTSKDGHAFVIAVAIDFSIVDLRLMFDSLSSPEITLEQRAASIIAGFASQSTKASIGPRGIELAANLGLATFGCGLGSVTVRVTDFAFTRVHRLLMNEHRTTAGLYHGFDGGTEPGAAV